MSGKSTQGTYLLWLSECAGSFMLEVLFFLEEAWSDLGRWFGNTLVVGKLVREMKLVDSCLAECLQCLVG